MERRVVVVGLGHAGARFIRACLSIGSGPIPLRIAGIIDSDPQKLAAFEPLGFAGFTDVASARMVFPVDLAIITVPERQHYQVVADIKRYHPATTRILCEKRLASNTEEAQALTKLLANDELTVNFVERFSPAVEDLVDFLDANRRRVSRIYCSWGKYRIKDPRLTPDVLTELSHPVDLVLYVSRVPVGTKFRVVSATSAKSNYNIGAKTSQALDTVHFAAEFENGLQFVGASSYLWPRRRREIELLLTDASGAASELAHLVFDEPIWDLDRLEIYDVRVSGGHPKLVYRNEVASSGWPPDRLTVGKVCRFVEANLEELEGRPSAVLPRLDQGVYVQEILEAVGAVAERDALGLTAFCEPAVSGAVDSSTRVSMLGRLSRREPPEEGDYVWDKLY